jgi:deoxyribonucleoside regulator
MTKYARGEDREELLADVSEMYYEQDRTQAEIARDIGVTRSAVSRMLSEAREKGIVEIHLHRPLRFDPDLEQALVNHFQLQCAHVVVWQKAGRYDELRVRLGKAAAQVLKGWLTPQSVLGVAWGTTVAATIDALDVRESMPVKVVQLVGVLGSSSHAYNAQALVERLARKLGGQATYLYTPFIVENADTARELIGNQSVREAVELGKQSSIALLGIGTTTPEFSALYQGGHISREMLESLRQAGAVGDVSALHFDLAGRVLDIEFHRRLVGIAREDLLTIPIRLGVAGGIAKAEAILGALRGRLVNAIIIDSVTAERVLAKAGPQAPDAGPFPASSSEK